MSKQERTVLQVSMTREQMDLLEAILQIIHHDRYTKTGFVMECIRNNARNYLGFPDDIGLTDTQLLDMVIDKNQNDIIAFIGQEKYDALLNKKEGEKNE